MFHRKNLFFRQCYKKKECFPVHLHLSTFSVQIDERFSTKMKTICQFTHFSLFCTFFAEKVAKPEGFYNFPHDNSPIEFSSVISIISCIFLLIMIYYVC